MEELLQESNLNTFFPAYHPPQDKGLGQSWEEINRTMRRSLNLPQIASEIPTHYQEYHRKRQLSEVGKVSSHHSSTKKQVSKDRSGSEHQDTRKRLKIIRDIAEKEQDESYQASIRNHFNNQANQERQDSQNQNRPQKQRMIKEVKLNIAGDLELSSTDVLQRSRKALTMTRYPLLGKQNHSPSKQLNIIHQENFHLEQTIKTFNQNQSQMTQTEINPSVRRYHSENKYEKLPIIINLNHLAQEKKIESISIHANPRKSKIMHKSVTKSKSESKFIKEKQDKIRAERQFASLSRKYKIFLSLKLTKLRLSEC